MNWVNNKQLHRFDPPLAVEHLVYEVKPQAFVSWLEAEFEFWTKGEADRFPILVGKEMWLCEGDPHKVTIILYWESLEQWKAIDPQWLAEHERQFSEVVGADNFRLVFEGHAQEQYFKISEYR